MNERDPKPQISSIFDWLEGPHIRAVSDEGLEKMKLEMLQL